MVLSVALEDYRSHPHLVTPAKAGVQGERCTVALDSRFRGHDIGREDRR
jgi:hypothetical protein